MSQKSGKKLRKREDNPLETSAKLITAEQKSEVTNIENGLEKEENTNLQDKMGESEINGTNDNSETTSKVIVCVDSEVVEEFVAETEVITNQKETENDKTIEHTTVIGISEVVVNNENNEENQGKPNEGYEKGQEKPNINEKNEAYEQEREIENELKPEVENELEPLLLESEEPEPELEFDESSDIDSQKSSLIFRCTTRRSQSKNIPIPKTPKSVDTNSDDKTSECSDKPSIVTVPTPEITDTESELSVFKPVTDIYDSEKILVKTVDDEFDSFQNISTQAIVGNDTTRNIDFSTYPDEEVELSPFLIQSRERPVGETLKLLSARRSIRSTREYSLQNNNKKEYKKATVDKLIGIKRKNKNDSPDYSKRIKTETSPPHLLSYISSPINTLKSRFNKSELPSSTPKLTSYKSKNVFDNTNVSKISLNETESVAEKKWCTVM